LPFVQIKLTGASESDKEEVARLTTEACSLSSVLKLLQGTLIPAGPRQRQLLVQISDTARMGCSSSAIRERVNLVSFEDTRDGTTGRCTISAPGDPRVALGFDGFVCNEDSAFVSTYVNLKQEPKPAAVAKFETRWQPPLAFFERMASRYPLLTFVMRVDHEDDESYPNAFANGYM